MTNSRDAAIVAIRTALKARSGKAWSVTGGRGTGWGWIRIDAPPAERIYTSEGTEGGSCMSLARRAELGTLLGLERPCHAQGESIPASSAYYTEYSERAAGLTPSVVGRPYWD